MYLLNPDHFDILNLTDEEISHIFSFFKEKHFPKGTFLLQEGESSNLIFFIRKGLVREFTFCCDENGNESSSSLNFMHEGMFALSIESYLSNSVSKSHIQALENTHTAFIKKEDLEKLSHSLHSGALFLSVIYQSCLAEQEKKNRILKSPNSKLAYSKFISAYPGIAERIPDKFIASYLNIHPNSLSRLRGKRN